MPGIERMTRAILCTAALVPLCTAVAAQAAGPAGGGDATMAVTARFSFGADTGRNWGALFEGASPDGRFTVGAGFLGACNTMMRSDRYVVHFFVRPTEGTREPSVEKLPRPGEAAGTYLFDLDGDLYATDPARGGVVKWNPAQQEWMVDDSTATLRLRVGDALVVGGDRGAAVDGTSVLPPPEMGAYVRPYYALGHWCFFHTYSAGESGYRSYESDEKGFSRLYACPWEPSDGTIDLSRAVWTTLPVVGEVPFTWGQLGGRVVASSNIGGVYVFDGRVWHTLVEPDTATSYQLYAALNYYDRLLLGQYPTGELFEFDGERLTRLEGRPPRPENVSASAREAQTATIYAGELIVGVWPWGEVWRLNPNDAQWRLMGRFFTHPEPTAATTHPYETECRDLGLVLNQWGQRITGLVPLGSDLIVSTSAKWPCEWKPEYTFLPDGAWQEYGALHRVRVPGHVSAPVPWSAGPVELRFEVGDGEMRILREGEVMASAPLPPELTPSGLGEVTEGFGIYGRFAGEALTVTVHETVAF